MIVCQDGFKFSVQGGTEAYSNPRLFTISYSQMEIGFPNQIEPLIIEYAEDSDYINTVYPYVPIEIIISVIKKHGGFEKNWKKSLTN
jgi:hypothetical protein